MKKIALLLSLSFALSLFAGDKTKTVTLSISGMHCQSCANTVEKALQKVEGVSKANVALGEQKATITIASTTSTASLIKAVSDAGFSANAGGVPAKSQMEKKSSSKHKDGSEGCCEDECETPAKGTTKTKAKKS